MLIEIIETRDLKSFQKDACYQNFLQKEKDKSIKAMRCDVFGSLTKGMQYKVEVYPPDYEDVEDFGKYTGDLSFTPENNDMDHFFFTFDKDDLIKLRDKLSNTISCIEAMEDLRKSHENFVKNINMEYKGE